ncbi:MAG TPA: hypothetical protein VG206_11590 [Terriglobia bacterium]|nr:hypothetical protein [Terriglobia bacterium]
MLNFDSGQLFYPASESLFTCPAGSASAGSTILVGQLVSGNMVTNIDPVGQKVTAGFPLPNRAGYPNFINQNPLVRNDSQFGVRVDRSFGEHDRIFARYLFAQSNFLDPGSGYTTLPTFGDTIFFRGQNVATGWTHTFGPALLNEVHLGFQRNDPLTQCQECPRPAGFEENFGIKNLSAPNPSLEGFPFFSFSNFSGVGDSNYRPTLSLEQTEDYGDDLTWTHGRHTLVVGDDFQWWQNLPWESPYSPHGQFTQNGQYSSLAGELPGTSGVSDLADLELGYTALAARSVQYKDSNFVSGTFLDWFGQDDIRVGPNLSVNLGLRYEFRGPPVDR